MKTLREFFALCADFFPLLILFTLIGSCLVTRTGEAVGAVVRATHCPPAAATMEAP